MFERLASLINKRAWALVAVGVVLALGAGIGAGVLNRSLASGGFADSSWQSLQAIGRLEHATGEAQGGGIIALIKLGADIDSAGARAEIAHVAQTMKSDPSVDKVLTYYDTHDVRMVAKDRQSTYLVAVVKLVGGESAVAARLQKQLATDPRVTLGGGAVAINQVNDTIGEDLGRAEALAFPLLFLLSLWVFRGVVAALMPLLVGGLTIVTALFLIRFINTNVTPISVYALNLITGMGLGLAIDYSLFIVSRYREELGRGLSVNEAMTQTMRHAGRTIFFSSLTVAAAMASLLLFPLRFLYSMGIGGIVVVAVGSLISLFVLTSVLRLLGPRINALAPKRWQRTTNLVQQGFWYRLASAVMHRPLPVATAAAIVLIGLGLPFIAGIRFTSVDQTVLPHNFSARHVDDELKSNFPSQAGTTVLVVAEASRDRAAQVQQFASAVASQPGVSGAPRVQPVNSNTWLLEVDSRSGNFSTTAQDLVKRIRSQPAPFPILVGGQTAEFYDLQQSLLQRMPAAVVWVAVATIILLFLMTGSVILPIKSVLMNVLTLSAAFGILVLIFQDGRFQDLLSYSSQGALEQTQPILLFAIVFGLSTDYAVFLLTRIKEAHDRGLENRPAVASGLERTGRIVTAAALLFCVAIGAFSTSRIVFIKELGVGTAAGVLIDATVVRALLVPSLMALMGRWNWWAPKPLRRLHERIGLREGREAVAA